MKRKIYSVILFLALCGFFFAQKASDAGAFWSSLNQQCGKAFEGKVTNDSAQSSDFLEKRLTMSVFECSANTVKVGFFVGEDASRTWIFTRDKSSGNLTLKHDHRKKDGSPDEITQYGGTSSNKGTENIQFFPADSFTAGLVPAAAQNVWWIQLDEDKFVYNLNRIGTDRKFSVSFNLKHPVQEPRTPWGWIKK